MVGRRQVVWAVGLVVGLSACVGGLDAEVEVTQRQGSDEAVEGEKRVADREGVVAEVGQVCGGACGDLFYTPCTCDRRDPCGWREDGVCDSKCGALTDTPFVDTDDCGVDCAVTICLTGAMNQGWGSNDGFAAICEDPAVPGLIPDCGESPCLSTFDNFFQGLGRSIYPALFDALDTNSDAQIDDDDLACEVNILGFSWGGVNALELAEAFVSDPKVSRTRAFVDRVLIMDAYQPLAGRSMNVPTRVRRLRSWRHSVSPEGDCSEWSPLGPYEGLAPRCHPGSDCVDRDFSLAPEKAFSTAGGGRYFGDQVGHCLVPYVAHEAVIAELVDEPFEGAVPPSVRIKAHR